MSEAPNDKTTRGVVDILVYATARLLLVVAVSAAIFGVARLIGLTEFPVVVATLFGLIIAMPLGIWVFSPLRLGASLLIRAARPVASPALDLYGLLSPRADRHLLARPEFKAMFLDDLLNGSRKQLAAPFADVIAFARDWGFRLDEVKVPVRWWHGDHDHIVPFSHGEHVVSRLPDAKLLHLPGESHLAGLGRGEEILSTLMQIWDRDLRK